MWPFPLAASTFSPGWTTPTHRAYHTGAPVILDPADWSTWLDPTKEAAELMVAVRPERFEIAEAA